MEKTVAAISTGNAPGGIGVIRISGSRAVDIAAKVFLPLDGSSLTDLKGYRAKYGNIIIDGEKADNAVALVFRAPKSYTGEDVAELSVHGGILMVRKTLQAVLEAGAEPAEAGEFTKRAFLNGKIDLTQAESVAELISAEGEQSLKASFNALQGALSKRINSVLESLLDASASMAAWVDYPDEDIPELSEAELEKTLKSCRAQLKELLDNYESGKTVTKGVDTAIVGRPNAGKSSLMNMLARTEKSIVTHIEGTTRDIVEENVSLGGIILHLRDTAGLRASDDLVESIGIEKAYKALDGAELVLAVFDNAEKLSESDTDLIERCKGRRAIAVINKTDLNGVLNAGEIKNGFKELVYVSAKNGEGGEQLAEAVKRLLGVAEFDSSAPLLANARQKKNCKAAYDDICEALYALGAGVTYDAINVMIDAAADELLSLTGKKASAEVVNNIFSKFCVGK
ncbi:MAG: tRNA uridine-5-carboxymethylaminomethyl(34) synthesis GTPase MnmE [Eubacterium sp.]|nr:tRNA uridine-5-carboxymethylaminomethyl(34) synthesis GTPase MnmE [Eubacterium sp.]